MRHTHPRRAAGGEAGSTTGGWTTLRESQLASLARPDPLPDNKKAQVEFRWRVVGDTDRGSKGTEGDTVERSLRHVTPFCQTRIDSLDLRRCQS